MVSQAISIHENETSRRKRFHLAITHFRRPYVVGECGMSGLISVVDVLLGKPKGDQVG